jgi:hypothetical protein
MTAYDEVLELLGDAEWRARRELDELTVLPDEWLREVLLEGREILDDELGGAPLRRPPSEA